MSSPCKSKPPIQDFLATVLVLILNIFSRDSLVAFNSYQSEKVRNTRIVNLTFTTIRVYFFFLLILVTAIGGRPKPELCFLSGWLR